MEKVIHPCDVPMWDGKKYPMFCKIEFTDGKLSISGVIGPNHHGNAKGGCGQIDMEFDHENKADNDTRYSEPIKASSLRFSAGWSRKSWYKFLDIWKHWHLNDMNSACEHQEALGWKYETHRGNYVEVIGKNDKIQEQLDELRVLLETCPPDYLVPDKYGDNFKLSDTGVLLKFDKFRGHKCPECGYEIGSAWLRREVPQDLIEFLFSLPETDRTPAWV